MTIANQIEVKEPLVVHCRKCEYEWAPIYVPAPADDVVKALKGAKCPKCRSKDVSMGPLPKSTEAGEAEAWLSNGDTGISSETIWSVMMGRKPPRSYWHPDVPADPSDFGRCYRLLKVMPEWRARLGEVAAKYPKWKRLVESWDELTALYEEELKNADGMAPKLYARMQELERRGSAHEGTALTWQPIETAPKEEKALWWIVPKSPEECPINGSGDPIITKHAPYLHMGRWWTWSSLSKATHWMPLPSPPRVSRAGAPQE